MGGFFSDESLVDVDAPVGVGAGTGVALLLLLLLLLLRHRRRSGRRIDLDDGTGVGVQRHVRAHGIDQRVWVDVQTARRRVVRRRRRRRRPVLVVVVVVAFRRQLRNDAGAGGGRRVARVRLDADGGVGRARPLAVVLRRLRRPDQHRHTPFHSFFIRTWGSSFMAIWSLRFLRFFFGGWWSKEPRTI